MDYVGIHTPLFFALYLRVVRFLFTEDIYECIITNLPPEEYSPEELKKVMYIQQI